MFTEIQNTSRFSITGSRGFHITFPNGWTVSVQWGPHNYCDNYDVGDNQAPIDAAVRHESWSSTTAEIAAWPTEHANVSNWYDFNGDQVLGRQSPTEVLAFMTMIAAKDRS